MMTKMERSQMVEVTKMGCDLEKRLRINHTLHTHLEVSNKS